jgi:hypothetical protein
MPSDGSTSSLPPTSDETIIAILNSLPSRKEMKQDTGLIRLSSGPVDSRDVLFEAIYKAPEDSDSEGEEEEFFGGGAVYSDEEFDEDMEDESMSEGSSSEEDAEEMEDVQKDIEPPSSRKQKRKREAQENEQGPKSKKVSFSVPDRRSKKLVKQPPKKASKPSPKKPINATKSNVPAQDGERDYNFSTYF